MKFKASIVFISLILSGCGGGGEDWASQDPSASAVSPNTFNIQAGWTKLLSAPYTRNLNISGSCTGSYAWTQSTSTISSGTTNPVPAKNYTFITRVYRNCSLATMNGSLSYTITNSYDFINQNLFNTRYDYANLPNIWRTRAIFPTAAKVGDTGLIGIIDNYKNSTGTSKNSVEEWSYVIEQDTASSVVFHLISKVYNTNSSINDTDYLSASVIQTEDYRYVVGPQNVMALRTYDFENASARLHGTPP